jgi:ribonuclease-3
LSRLRARVVSSEPLAEVAAGIGLGDALQLGSGELKTGGFRRQSILADALEAVCGALFLDGGLTAAERVIEALFLPRIAALPAAAALKDAKTRLQEYLQSRGLALPRYTVDRIEGEPHAQTFRVTCDVPDLGLSAQGRGSSRRRAEQEAAEGILLEIESQLDRKP